MKPAGESGRQQLDEDDKPLNRLERRKQRTRAALIKAAQGFIAAGTVNVPVQDISQAADVGVGSFYNHFESKEQLFEAAINEVLDAHGALLDELTAPLDDPAEAFACSFRLTGRMFRRPDSRTVLNHGLALITADRGLAPRAKRDIAAAAAAGRFQAADPELAMAVAAGALLGLGQLLQDQPERNEAQATDLVTEDLLRLFGLSAEEAHELCSKPLPELAELGRPPLHAAS
ncbi:TetR family transcriptional regulator [Mycobacterium lacus]|uniref:Putative TetR-family transcriptional regulator n=1 Tax=Mycobacterium lacus TaxID=169765 RepID=A0A1X1XY26_9MYCO|nr:TetR/AcrR family transcriptional regulator [Mycobacterium lacus]ORW03773.1 TetR family transcriptional regulator [Mycobacterium lacus]BBX96947.1 putative TetR-family transcriptional regulator [Mycobacterium lacus]